MTTQNSNPFCTRFTRPGELAFLFDGAESLETIASCLKRHRACQIVGPHGSGKTTLLESLQSHLQQTGQRVVRIVQNDGNRSINATKQEIGSWSESTLVVIDGFEQLSWLRRRQLIKKANQGRFRLLVTTHRDLGLPLAFRTRIDRELVCQIVRQLQGVNSDRYIDNQDIDSAIEKHPQNMREILFDLYDVWNAKKRVQQTQSAD